MIKDVLEILHQVLTGKYVTPKAEITSNGKIDFLLHNVNDKVTITFGANKPMAIAKFILRVKCEIDNVVFDGDYAYVKPVGWPAITVNLKELESMGK